MEQRPLIILVPLVYEAKAIARALGLSFDKSKNCAMGSFCTFRDVRLHVIGPGAQVMPDLEDDAGAIILAGLAGALDPSLQIGNVLIDSSTEIPSDHPLFDSARAARIVSQPRIAATGAEKAELFRSTGAAAVDMEGEIVRRRAESLGVPLIHLRAISDRADEPIDPVIATFVTAAGRTNPPAVVLAVLRRPWLMKQLLRLRRNSARALSALSDALRAWARSGAAWPVSVRNVDDSRQAIYTRQPGE